jgi:hypothetical protein
MDLLETWKKLGEEKLNKPVGQTSTTANISRHPVSKLILTFKVGLAFIVFFQLLFGYVLIVTPQPLVKIGMAVIIAVYFLLLFINLGVLRKMMRLNNLDQNTHQTLAGVYAIVTGTLAFQQKLSWGFFPLCVGAGFLLGLSGSGDVATIMATDPVFPVVLIIMVIIITPFCRYMTKRMNEAYYGKYLEQLKSLMRQMEED